MTTISSPFRIDASGRLAVERSLAREVEQRLLAVVMTNSGERVMRPGFGADVARNLFDPHPEGANAGEIRTRIIAAATVEVPDVIVRDVRIAASRTSQSTVEVTVLYSVPPDQAERTTVAVVPLGGFTEEIPL